MQDNPNIKKGNKAEYETSLFIASKGGFVGNFNKGMSGSQPFDQIAITKNKVIAYDVKNCSTYRFDFRRVEDNQVSALGFINNEIRNKNVVCGFVLVHNDMFKFLNYNDYLTLINAENKSVDIRLLEDLELVL